MKETAICQTLPPRLRECLAAGKTVLSDYEQLQLRRNCPVTLIRENCRYYLDQKGHAVQQTNMPFLLTQEEMDSILLLASRYSVYASEASLREGYLTLAGGHRLGLCGEVMTEDRQITGIRYVHAYHFRIAHEKKDCAKAVYPYLWEKDRFLNTLIVSAPGRGKTTLLRDLIRLLSDGTEEHPGMTISIADERGELAGCVNGIPQYDIGLHSDVMDKGRKEKTMSMLIRTMAPQVIAADELGGPEECEIVREACSWGVGILTTVHGMQAADSVRQRRLEALFQRYIEIQMQPERCYCIYDDKYSCIGVVAGG